MYIVSGHKHVRMLAESLSEANPEFGFCTGEGATGGRETTSRGVCAQHHPDAHVTLG